MDKRRIQVKRIRKGKRRKVKKEQKIRKLKDTGGKGCPGPTRGPL